MSSTRADLDPRDGPRRWGWVFAAIWMFYLLNPLEAGWSKRDTVAGWVAIVATVLFAAIYLGVFLLLRWRRAGTPFRITPSPALGVVAVAVEIALAVTICLAIGQAGTATAVYIAVLSMISLPSLWGWIVAAAVACTTYAATLLVDGWESDRGILFGTLVAALAIWGISQSISRNIEMLSVREENARLALEDERNRFARDLHDILGHSLTVITVKAELAQKLFDVDPTRARAEVTDLERLSRDALADVRRAVEGYRELTLPGELARARIALEAAEIEADLPNSTDEVPSSLRELFAWTIREGVTNVVRHSGARRCTVTLTASSAEIADDGRGALGAGVEGMPVGGHGLLGLRERAAAVGATVVTTTLNPGFSLKVVKA
ncbi:histidine kinase [Intrasporangium oryzae NRRL B-24470]|uniref:Histidine kinase n=1 Tax=Intrasporangium oryzae NRRL B-24470 TaxID=1386089 RepID=W9G713_9MICO|nr:sensor histidine kinase [Intrasporangium oryzae]EWT01971.1 histidine kinase [Intrasporangium oryzae NRRL B-24470]